MDIVPLPLGFGTRVTGINLSNRLGYVGREALIFAMDDRSLCHFPNQEMTDKAQLTPTRLFGVSELNHVKYGAVGVVDHFGTAGNASDETTQKGNNAPPTRTYQRAIICVIPIRRFGEGPSRKLKINSLASKRQC